MFSMAMFVNTTNGSLDNSYNDHDITYQQTVSTETVRTLTKVFGVALTTLIAVCGSVGNVLTLIVLRQKRLRNPTDILMAALAISDLMFLLFSLTFSVIIIYKGHDPIGGENLRKMTYPYIGAYGSIVFGRITTLLTVLLSFERCIAVYFPMRVRFWCGKRNICAAILFVYVTTLILFIPYPLKYKIKFPENSSFVVLCKSSLGKQIKFYAIYGTILNAVFRFIPIICLIVLNILIILAIRKTWSLRRIMSKNSRHSTSHEQKKITLMLLVVSIVFLVCILPGAANNLASKFNPGYSRLGKNRNLYLSISCVTYFLETVNSSVNFIIYLAFSSKFKRTYIDLCCCRAVPEKHQNTSREVIRFSCSRRNESSSSSGTHDWTRLSSFLNNRTVPNRDHPIGVALINGNDANDAVRLPKPPKKHSKHAERFS